MKQKPIMNIRLFLFAAGALLSGVGSAGADVPANNVWPNATFEAGVDLDNPAGTPDGWNRGGNEAAICQVTGANAVSPTHSLIVNDTSATGYGEWYSDLDLAGLASGGDDLDLHWHELFNISGGEMRLTLLFFNTGNGVIGERHFVVSGQSAGWAGTLEASPWVVRDQRVPIPPDSARLRLSLVSGGSAETTGVLAIDDLSVSIRRNPVLLPNNFWHNPGFESGENLDQPSGTLSGWNRGGSNPALCEVSTLNSVSTAHSLAVVDTDIAGYAEWYSDLVLPAGVTGGNEIDLQWFEMFSTSGEFRLSVLFFGGADNVLGQSHFVVAGASAGFTGDLATSPFIRRNERVLVAAGAVRIRISLVSGGPFNATGTMLIDDLSVAKVPPPVVEVLPGNFRPNPGFELGENLDRPQGTPAGWNRGGNDGAICQVSTARAISPTHSLSVVDQNAAGYGEWYCDQALSCSVHEGRAINIQWFELFDVSAGGEMRFSILFFNAANAVMGESHYVAKGQSAGWTGDLAASPFVRRNVQLVIPAGTRKMRTSLVSGGSQETTGTMLIDNLSVALEPTPPTVLFGNLWPNPAFEAGTNLDDPNAGTPTGWQRGGNDAAVDIVTSANYTSSKRALAVVDNNNAGYGEWYANLDLTGRATGGEMLNLQWFELYNVSAGGSMRLSLLFWDPANTLLQQVHYVASGPSAGWKGDIACSSFTRRNEQIIVPDGATRLQVSLVSGGPRETTGTLVIDDLSIAKPPPPPMVLPFNFWPNPTFELGAQLDNPLVGLPDGGWGRGGSDSRICQVSHEKASSPTHGLAMVDNNASGYGEWYADVSLAGHAAPGDTVELQWLEVFDTTGDMRVSILFFSEAGGIVLQRHYVVKGQSAGWTGDLASSPFVKRNQSLVVPAEAVRMRVSLVSGGGLDVTGTMIIDDFSVQLDAIRFQSVQREAGGLALTWNSKPDQTYAVESSEKLGPDANWSPLATGIASGGETTSFVDDFRLGSPSIFYRVRQE